MKELSLGKISIHIYGEDIVVKDLFINDESFQHYLRSSFKNEFSNGRFKEPFMLRLEPKLSSLKESKKSSSNHLLYSCVDACCDYIFVSIKLDNNKIIWDKIGRNTDYVYPKSTMMLYHLKTQEQISAWTDIYLYMKKRWITSLIISAISYFFIAKYLF